MRDFVDMLETVIITMIYILLGAIMLIAMLFAQHVYAAIVLLIMAIFYFSLRIKRKM